MDLTHYQKTFENLAPNLPGSALDWVEKFRIKALDDFLKSGFPGRKDEQWRYTPTYDLANKLFKPSISNIKNINFKNNNELMINIEIFDNHIKIFAPENALPKNTIICSLQEALIQYPERVKPYLHKIMAPGFNAFSALNTTFWQQGVFIDIAPNESIEYPIALNHYGTESGYAQHNRHLILLGEGAKATVFERYEYTDLNSEYFSNIITEINLKSNATLEYIKLINENNAAYHIAHTAVDLYQSAHLNAHAFTLGGKLIRSDLSATFLESKGQCLLNGLYLMNGEQHCDHHTAIIHESPDCQSQQLYKGIITDKARAVFNGKVRVAPHAIGTVAEQMNNNLLLSRHSEIDTKPELEIYADDVKCVHGATVGQLDEDALFYLQSRGILKDDARMLLLKGYGAEQINAIENNMIKKIIEKNITEELSR